MCIKSNNLITRLDYKIKSKDYVWLDREIEQIVK